MPRETTAGLPTVAVRCPANTVTRRIIAAAGVPVAAPSAAFCGDCRKVLEHKKTDTALTTKKIIGRRCLMELRPNSVINLGIGIPDGIGAVADEEGMTGQFTLSVESGPIGGVPTSDKDFGCAYNPEAIIDQCAQFDGYDGGGLDMSFLGLAEVDPGSPQCR